MFTVYHVVNLRNGKGYVGLTSRAVSARWESHLSSARQGSPFRFHSAIRKYGPDSFEIIVLNEGLNEEEARKLEAKEIEEREYLTKGYNAKPGGCGGWIVKPENYDGWYARLSASSVGAKNPNALDTTNEQLVALGLEFVKERGFIPGRKRLRLFGEDRGIKVPQIFTDYRFGGYAGFTAELERLTGLKYNQYFRDEEQKQKLRKANLGKKRGDS